MYASGLDTMPSRTCVVILLALAGSGYGQYVNIWDYSACSYEYGGRCSRSCAVGEQTLNPFYCFYGLAQCCVSQTNNCESVGGSCRQGCGLDSLIRDTSIKCSGQQSCCVPGTSGPSTPAYDNLSVTERQGACGAASLTRGRILNGYAGRPCEWPWMASLRHISKGLFCSGVLVNNETVLTAAHCVINAPVQEIRVHLGDFDTNRFDNTEVSYAVKNIDIVTGYTIGVKGRNLALVKLATPVQYDRCKAPACLPDPNIAVKKGTGCYIAGFGQTGNGKTSTLQAADVTVLDRNVCQNLLQISTRENLPEDVLCSNTLKDNTDGCKGDDGGMLVCPDVQNRWSLVGTISYYSCNRLPTLYTDIAYYTQWILDRL